jgi:hypothetical protein
MMAEPNLPAVAAQFRHRFFAEIVGASLQNTGVLGEGRATGRRLELVRKVIVSGQAVAIVCALLLTSSLSVEKSGWSTDSSHVIARS